MTSLDVGYQNQADLTRGVAIFTDAMRSVVRRELEARDGAAWWDIGVWPWLSPGQRKAIDESRSNDSTRPPEDFLDASHFRTVTLDSGVNYPLFARYLPGRGDARRAFETARHAKIFWSHIAARVIRRQGQRSRLWRRCSFSWLVPMAELPTSWATSFGVSLASRRGTDALLAPVRAQRGRSPRVGRPLGMGHLHRRSPCNRSARGTPRLAIAPAGWRFASRLRAMQVRRR